MTHAFRTATCSFSCSFPPIGDITLDIIRNVVILTDEDSGGRCFNIELEGGMRTFELRAATVADADRWVRVRVRVRGGQCGQ